jgi:hypothetical protein
MSRLLNLGPKREGCVPVVFLDLVLYTNARKSKNRDRERERERERERDGVRGSEAERYFASIKGKTYTPKLYISITHYIL